MRKIITKDGSITFFNEKYQESYHHESGALNEALKKFVEPCKITELARKGSVDVLDVCFGLGYNSGVAIDAAIKANPDCKIKIIALEKDELVLDKIKELDPDIENYDVGKM